MSSKSWNGESSYISYQNKNLVVSPSGEVIELPQQRKQQTQRQDAGSQSNQKKNLVVSPSGQVVELPYPFETINLPQHRSQQKDLEQQTSNKLQQRHQDPIIKRHMSLEFLNPVHECHSRKSSIIVAVVNLVATVCGGGVLSLPFAFRRAGIIPTTIMMIYGFVSTDFTLYILISCARRTGGRSYGDVAKAAFGNAAEVFTTALMGVMLLGSLTAYLVLVKDIWTPVVMFVLPTVLKQLLVEKDILYDNNEDNEQVASKEGGNFILLCILILGTPLLLKNDLHALRHTCYVGFSSCALLVVALVYHAYAAVQLPRPIELNWYSTNLSDLAFCFPIIVLCFFCSYNALGVHSSLLNPTRERVKFVLDSSMLICWT